MILYYFKKRVLLPLVIIASFHYCNAQVKERWIVKVKRTVEHTLQGSSTLRGSSTSSFFSTRLSNDVSSLLYVVESNAKPSVKHLLDSLYKNGLVEYFERDAIGYGCATSSSITPNDPAFNKQWYLNNDGSLSLFGMQAKQGADIQVTDAWDISQGNESTTVAILDTGIDEDHPELINRLWINKSEIANNGIDDDQNGFVDDIHGWNFVHDSKNVADDNGHGTAIAGVIGANSQNEYSLAGINWHCKLMVVKVLESDQSGYYSDWAAGIYYAVKNGADVINMSVAGEEDLRTLADAINYAYSNGVLVVCSMGNHKDERTYFPAGYENCLAVGSTDPNDNRSLSFIGSDFLGSNYGINIDLIAPGNVIYGLSMHYPEAVTLWGGTSISSGVVTGVVSLLLAINKDLTPRSIKHILLSSAEDQVGLPQEDIKGWDKYYGFGRLNAYQALTLLQSGNGIVNAEELNLYPNPTVDFINVAMLLPSVSPVQVQIIDLHGKVWQQYNVEINTPLFNYMVRLTNLSPATYILSVKQDGKKVFKRFVVVK